MKELFIQYCYSQEQWGLFDPDVDDFIFYANSITGVTTYAYELAPLIKPCQIKFIPQYLLTSFTIFATYQNQNKKVAFATFLFWFYNIWCC